MKSSRILSIIILAMAAALFVAGPVCALAPNAVKLQASDGKSGDSFGHAVALSENLELVGAYESQHLAGSAYVFNRSGQQLLQLKGNDTGGNDDFGVAVALSGDLAVVGARGNDLRGVDSGAAYVFDANTGQQLRRLETSFLSAGDEFGYSIAMQGTTTLVGAWTENVTGVNSGAAYLFDASTGDFLRRLIPNDSKVGQWFGTSVAMSSSKAIVGAFGDSPGTLRGAAYIFDTATGNQLLKLTPSDGAAFDEFGTSVAIDGDLAVVGSPFHKTGGEVYVFNVLTGAELFRLVGTGIGTNYFGQSVAIKNGIIAVGDPEAGGPGLEGQGALFLFDAATGKQLSYLTAPDATVGDNLGSSVAMLQGGPLISGAQAAGNPSAQTDAGAAYIFAVPEPNAVLLVMAAVVGMVIQNRPA